MVSSILFFTQLFLLTTRPTPSRLHKVTPSNLPRMASWQSTCSPHGLHLLLLCDPSSPCTSFAFAPFYSLAWLLTWPPQTSPVLFSLLPSALSCGSLCGLLKPFLFILVYSLLLIHPQPPCRLSSGLCLV